MKHVTVGAFAALLLVLALAGRVSGAGVAVEEEEVEVEDSSHSSRELHHVGPAPVLEEYELDPTCDYEAYKAFQDANRVELTAKANQCATLIDELRKIQFGPPSGWMAFNTMCKGVCVDYFFLAREANAAGDCNCKPYAASETWARYKTREEYMCWKWPVDMYCETHGVCMGDAHFYHRHTCEGCGWEAAHEDQWREERDPDFGCTGCSLMTSLWQLVVCIAVLAAVMVQIVQ